MLGIMFIVAGIFLAIVNACAFTANSNALRYLNLACIPVNLFTIYVGIDLLIR